MKNSLIVVLGLLALMPSAKAATAQISDNDAIKAIESSAEVHAIYSLYYSHHAKGNSCSNCSVDDPAEIQKEEQSKVTLKDCYSDPNNSVFTNCNATLSKYIFTDDNYIQELTIEASLAADLQKKTIYVDVNKITFQREMND